MKSLLPVAFLLSLMGCANQTKIDPQVSLANEMAAVRKDIQVSLSQQDKLVQSVGNIKQQNNGLMSGGAVYAVATAGLFVLAIFGLGAIWLKSKALTKAGKAARASLDQRSQQKRPDVGFDK